MSELQNDSVESEGVITPDDQQIEDQNPVAEEGAELATASEAEHEDQQQAEDNPVEKRFAELTFKRRQAEREKEELAAKLQEYERKQQEDEAALIANIPPVPEWDGDDAEYERKLRERDAAIARKAQFDAKQEVIREQQLQQQQQDQQKAIQKVEQDLKGYEKRKAEFGFTDEEMQKAGETVAQYGISNEAVLQIVADEDGPLFTKYLAANPSEGIALAQMNPVQQGIHLERLRSKVVALKPKPSNAPPPPDSLQGNSSTPVSEVDKANEGFEFR